MKTKRSKPSTDTERDAKMMSTPLEWPCWPYLPIKRHPKDHSTECALLWAAAGHHPAGKGPFSVFAANIFHLPPTAKELEATKKYEYLTVEAVLADGWVVD